MHGSLVFGLVNLNKCIQHQLMNLEVLCTGLETVLSPWRLARSVALPQPRGRPAGRAEGPAARG